MARRAPYWQTKPEPQPGIPAKWPGQCARCFGPIMRGARVVFHKGRAIHTGCASGADDE